MATYKLITVVGVSAVSFADAAQSAVAEAAKTLRNLEWLEVEELRGRISGGKIAEYQAKVRIGFRLES